MWNLFDDEDADNESSDDDGDVNWDRAKVAARDRDGSVRWRGIWRAIRGRRSEQEDMVPWFVGVVLLIVVSVVTISLDGAHTVIDGLAWGVFLLLVFGAIFLKGIGKQLDEHYADDPDVESRLLAEQYADGDLDDEEFQRRIDLMLEDGPAAARAVDADDDSTDSGSGETATPLVTLRERFASGDIDESEYRNRLATLRETGDEGTRESGDDGEPGTPEESERREVERDRS